MVLAHLSQDCNRPELALRIVGERLRGLGASHVQVSAAAQDVPAATISLG